MPVVVVERRAGWAALFVLLVATSMLASCRAAGVRPTLTPTPTSTAPVTVSQLKAAPTVTDLAGRFAYGTRGANGHIWVVDTATGKRTQVTHGHGGVDFDPHWSPDGQRLVFRTERFHAPDPTSTGYNGIFVINADGTGEHAVNPPGGGLFPEWAPDGRIVFSGPRQDGTEGLLAVQPDGSHLQDLQIYAEHIGWNPTGTEVLLDRNKLSGGQNWDIWRVDARFANLVQLTDAPGDDSFGGWSPDGKAIVFSTKRNGHGEVWMMNRDGTNQRPLVTGAGSQAAEGWLPDDRILVADNSTRTPAWYLLKPDGRGIVSLPQLHGIDGPVDYTAVGTSR
jgi:Tol biopolymer transport system component